MSELLDKIIQAIGTNCSHESYCDDSKCKYKGKKVCKVEQETARKIERIAIQYSKEQKEKDINY